jgi:hypothetical protein
MSTTPADAGKAQQPAGPRDLGRTTMLRQPRARLLLGVFLLAAGSSILTASRPIRAEDPASAIAPRPGADKAEVRKLFGDPSRISRQIFAHQAIEQWIYGPPLSLRIVFECRRGKKPVVQSVRPLRPGP